MPENPWKRSGKPMESVIAFGVGRAPRGAKRASLLLDRTDRRSRCVRADSTTRENITEKPVDFP